MPTLVWVGVCERVGESTDPADQIRHLGRTDRCPAFVLEFPPNEVCALLLLLNDHHRNGPDLASINGALRELWAMT